MNYLYLVDLQFWIDKIFYAWVCINLCEDED